MPDLETQDEREVGRLEAFSDGVIAVIITITALELKAPEGSSFHALKDRAPTFLVYLLSFAFIGIYWNNHHHMLRAARRLSAAVMWANLHLLFWLSLIPVLTEWVGEHWQDTAPAATYAVVALGAGLAYTLLQIALIKADGADSTLAQRLGDDRKGRASVVAYVAALGFAFLSPIISYVLFALVSVMWFIPDRRLT